VATPAPEGFEPGSPFGPGLCALIIHLHVTRAIGFERLVCLLSEVFGPALNEGAVANILACAETPPLAAAAPIAAGLRESPVVGSDETSARVRGKTWWHWVLLSSTAICHVIADTRSLAGFSQQLEESLEHARPAQPPEPLPHAVPLAIFRRQRAPRQIVDREEVHRFKELAIVVTGFSTAGLCRVKHIQHDCPVVFCHPRQHGRFP